MEQTLEKFKSHLFKVCKDDCLQKLALSFYEDLSRLYKGQVFVRENFEKLVVDGQVYEQDIVKELFADRDEVSAEEIFTYNFIKNVEELDFFEKDKGYAGIADVVKRRVLLYKPNSRQLFNYLIDKTKETPPLFSTFSKTKFNKKELTRTQISEYIECAKKYDVEMEAKIQALRKNPENIIKEIFYHEFCHLFEIRSFCDGKFKKNNFSSRVIEVKNKKRKNYFINLASSDEMLNNKDKFRKGNLYLLGSTALSEILNEELNRFVLGNFSIKNVSGLYHSSSQKKQMISHSVYRLNYDLAVLFKCAVFNENAKNFRFNANSAIEKFNQIPINKDILSMCIEDIKSNLQHINYDIYYKICNILDNLKGSNNTNFEIISILTGVFESAKSMDDSYVFYTKLSPKLTDFKENLQAVYMEIIKDSIIHKLNDDQLMKDDEFYRQLNQTLENVDDYIIYPVKSIEEKYLNENGELSTNIVSSLNYYSLERSVINSKYKLGSHRQINIFYDLFQAIKQHIESLPKEKKEKALSLLTFLEKQEELDKKYENLNRSVKFEDIYNERINNFAQKPVAQLDDSEKDLF